MLKLNTVDRVLHGIRTISILAMQKNRQVAVATHSTLTIRNSTTIRKVMATRTLTDSVEVANTMEVEVEVEVVNTITDNAVQLDQICMRVDHRIDRRKYRMVQRTRNDNQNRKKSK